MILSENPPTTYLHLFTHGIVLVDSMHTFGGLGTRGREARALKLKGSKDASHSTSSAAASLETLRHHPKEAEAKTKTLRTHQAAIRKKRTVQQTSCYSLAAVYGVWSGPSGRLLILPARQGLHTNNYTAPHSSPETRGSAANFVVLRRFRGLYGQKPVVPGKSFQGRGADSHTLQYNTLPQQHASFSPVACPPEGCSMVPANVEPDRRLWSLDRPQQQHK